LDQLILRDQLEAVRASLLQAIPINMLLGLASALVATNAGHGRAGWAWFACSTIANLLRILLCVSPCFGLTERVEASSAISDSSIRSVRWQLRLNVLAAAGSGCVWAFLPLLCAGYTSPQTLFYLTVTCGITAGAVTHGIAYARIPAAFITPPLLSVAGCLIYSGGFDRGCLVVTTVIYLAALLRSTVASQRVFREASRLKNEARAFAGEMQVRAMHDGLTGILNRVGFTRAMEECLAQPDMGARLLLLDLDGFKSVNDVYGHKTGDRVLSEVAKRLTAALPPACSIARLGGDEFAVLYPAAETGEAPAELAQRLIGVVSQRFENFDAGRLGVSIGICAIRGEGLTQLLSYADEALYCAKSSGRNRFHLFDDRLRRRLDMQRDCERDLSTALTDGSLEMWFQPIFSDGGRTIVNLEALIRWHHPNHGWIPSNELIAAAATAGLTEPVFRFVLDKACAMLRTLRAEGWSDIGVAINVSPGEMAQIAVDEFILERLRALALPPSMLEIEITEEALLDIDAVRDKITTLSKAGVRIALDDFGAGYSSLAYLRQICADRLKIDRSLVTGLAASEDKRGLVQVVLSLGQTLQIEVVAEGVETGEDLITLQLLGCNLMQGYHLSRPKPANDILELLAVVRAAA
jgi:diguanylate cyclase (GGDEF)-like protein